MSVSTVSKEEFQSVACNYVNVIAQHLNVQICEVSDEWFAPATNMFKADPPFFERVFIPSGLKMDGWESRRHNRAEFDHCIVKLGVDSAQIRAAEVDTAFFVGNYAPAVSIEGAVVESGAGVENATWETIIPKQVCKADSQHFYMLDKLTDKAYTHARICQYPDGGIARWKLYGSAVPVFPQDKSVELDLAHIANGGVAIGCSDATFGEPDNLLLPGRGSDMSDVWQTERSREPGHADWAIVKLGAKGTINGCMVDTAHHFGNYPQSITIEGLSAEESPSHDDPRWATVIADTPMGPHAEHELRDVVNSGPFTHVKLTMLPDGVASVYEFMQIDLSFFFFFVLLCFFFFFLKYRKSHQLFYLQIRFFFFFFFSPKLKNQSLGAEFARVRMSAARHTL